MGSPPGGVRRGLFRLAFVLLSPALAAAAPACPEGDRFQAEPLSGATLMRRVEIYARIGPVRTASPASARAKAWIRCVLERAGYEIRTVDRSYDRRTIEEASVSSGDVRVEGWPLWPPIFTEGAVRGPLVVRIEDAQAAPGAVALVRLDQGYAADADAPAVRAVIEAWRDAPIGALIIETPASHGEAVALNQSRHGAAAGRPVLLIGSTGAARLRERLGRDAVVKIEGARDPAISDPSFVARRGADRSAADAAGRSEIVVSTPLNGWFRAAGERGGGLALFLGLAEWLAQAAPERPVRFILTTGHELGGLGMDDILSRAAPPPDRTALWLHLGAGIGARHWRRTPDGRLAPSVEPARPRGIGAAALFLPLIQSIFEGQAGYGAPVDIRHPDAVGEMVQIRDAGQDRVIGLVGWHAHHHARSDGPETTEPALLEPIADGLRRLLEAVVADIEKREG